MSLWGTRTSICRLSLTALCGTESSMMTKRTVVPLHWLYSIAHCTALLSGKRIFGPGKEKRLCREEVSISLAVRAPVHVDNQSLCCQVPDDDEGDGQRSLLSLATSRQHNSSTAARCRGRGHTVPVPRGREAETSEVRPTDGLMRDWSVGSTLTAVAAAQAPPYRCLSHFTYI